jgi:hypothetical protein
MEPSSSNGFGSNTYWNRPTFSRSRSNRPSRSLSPVYRQSQDNVTSKAQALQSSATVNLSSVAKTAPVSTKHEDVKVTADHSLNLQRSRGVSRHSPDMSAFNNHFKDMEAELDIKDDKAMVKLMKSTLPQFSNEQDWEMAAFELTLVLDRVWPHKQLLDITDYLRTTYSHHNRDIEQRADSMIYFALTLAAKKDSFAKLQIMAASHPDAIPCVRQNEGKKLFQMFQSLFTMTTHHIANLPTMRKQLHDVIQGETEKALA